SLSPTYQLVDQLLGGRVALGRLICDKAEAHARICEGLPTRALVYMYRGLEEVSKPSLLAAMGMDQRKFQRRKNAAEQDPTEKLMVEEGSRLWKFAEVLARYTQTLGSKEAAERWLSSPQIGLGGHRPIELLKTAPGTEIVKDLLVVLR